MTAKKRKKAIPTSTSDDTVQAPVNPIFEQVFQPQFWKSHLWAGLSLFLLALVLYLPSLGFEYVLDDKIVMTENKFVKKGLSGIPEILGNESFAGYFGEQRDLVVGSRYRPLSIVTFAVEYQFFGLNSKVSHFFNILLYALTGLLLYRLLCLFFPVMKEERWYFSIAYIGALLFTLHPLHTEVVANVKGRDEILCLLGALSSIYLIWKYLYSNNILWLAASALTFFLSLLAKENALTFLAIVPLSIYYFTNHSLKKSMLVTSCLVLVAVGYLFVRYQVIGYFLSSGKEITDIMNNPFYGLSAGEKFGTIFYTLGQYLKLLFIPHPLTHDYYPYHIPVYLISDLKALMALVVNLILAVLALWGLRKKQVWAYGILFYFITLSIVSNIPFTVGTFMNERFLYIPSIGFSILMAWLIARKLPQWTSEKEGEVNILATGLLVFFVLGFGLKTCLRIPDWKSPFSLNQAAIKVSTNSARANCFMATALFNKYQEEPDQQIQHALLDDINRYLDKSLEIYPRYGSAILLKSGVVTENYKRDQDLDQLLKEFSALLKMNPRLQFIDQYLEYLNQRPAFKSKLAGFYFALGAWFANEQHSSRLALKYLQQYGLSVDPENRDLNRAVGQIYQKLNQAEKANYFLNKAN